MPKYPNYEIIIDGLNNFNYKDIYSIIHKFKFPTIQIFINDDDVKNNINEILLDEFEFIKKKVKEKFNYVKLIQIPKILYDIFVIYFNNISKITNNFNFVKKFPPDQFLTYTNKYLFSPDLSSFDDDFLWEISSNDEKIKINNKKFNQKEKIKINEFKSNIIFRDYYFNILFHPDNIELWNKINEIILLNKKMLFFIEKFNDNNELLFKIKQDKELLRKCNDIKLFYEKCDEYNKYLNIKKYLIKYFNNKLFNFHFFDDNFKYLIFDVFDKEFDIFDTELFYLYRGCEHNIDNLKRDNNMQSLSFGISFLGGLISDDTSITPFYFCKNQNNNCMLYTLNKKSFIKPETYDEHFENLLFLIPAYNSISNLIFGGEYSHPRTRVFGKFNIVHGIIDVVKCPSLLIVDCDDNSQKSYDYLKKSGLSNAEIHKLINEFFIKIKKNAIDFKK